MRPEELKTLQHSLERRKKEILGELSKLGKPSPVIKGKVDVQVEELGRDEYDNAIEDAELDRNFALQQQLERELHDLERALEKIQNGTYGACDKCQIDIHEKRLKAMPVASLCTNCAQKAHSLR